MEMGWREFLLLGAVVAAVYLVVALLGLVRLKRRREMAQAYEPPLAPRIVSDVVAHDLPDRHQEAVAMDVADGPTLPPDQAAGGDFAQQLTLRSLEGEVGRLRAELAALRDEVAALRTMPRPLHVSPMYAEAAALAGRGFDARGVAEECGISVAEAELVMAMSRDDKSFDSEVSDDGIGSAPVAGSGGR